MSHTAYHALQIHKLDEQRFRRHEDVHRHMEAAAARRRRARRCRTVELVVTALALLGIGRQRPLGRRARRARTAACGC